MYDVPVSAETHFAATESRPTAPVPPSAVKPESAPPESLPPKSAPSESVPPESAPSSTKPAASRAPGPRPVDSGPADSLPADSRPADSRPADSPDPDSPDPDSLPAASPKKCPDALAAEIATLAGHLNAAQYRFVKLLDEFDRAQGWAGPGVRSLAHWLNWKCGLGELMAREKVRVARALRELPLIDAAFERGEVSYSKVRAMTRAATPENETQLLNIARHGTAAHMERLVRVYRRCRKRADESPAEAAMRREERFYCFAEDDETMTFGGRVPVEQGRLLLKALDAMVAEMEQDEREAGDAEAADVAEAAGDAEAVGDAPQANESCKAGDSANTDKSEKADGGTPNADSGAPNGDGGTPNADGGAPNGDPKTAEIVSAETSAAASDPNVSAETSSGGKPDRPPLKPLRVRRAAALVHVAEHYLATRGSGSGASPLKSSDAWQVFVHVNANDAHPDNRINGAHTTYMDDRRCVAPHVARQLACDASRRTVLENDRGEVLNIGRRSRIVPWRIAHALRLRDGGCRFPGCNQQRWTDAHHIRHWADGGETSLANLITLCRYHHRALHRNEFRIERDAGGEPVFADARHRPIPPAIHPQFADERAPAGATAAKNRVEQLQAEHRERGIEIDESTAVTRWAGERMDYSTAVEWLQHADGVVVR